MQSFWVVLLFLRKQMLRILKHTFADQHPPPPLVSLVHPPPPPQQDVRIISCTYKEVCSCQLVKYIYIFSLFILAKFSCNYNQERESPITLIISWSKTSVNINYQQFKYYVKTWDQSFITLVITHWIYWVCMNHIRSTTNIISNISYQYMYWSWFPRLHTM